MGLFFVELTNYDVCTKLKRYSLIFKINIK